MRFEKLLRALSRLFGAPGKPGEAGDALMMDPKTLLYSLPTICDPIPATQPGSPAGPHQALHEDDWRQIEFVTAPNCEHIESKLAQLGDFKEQHRRGPGFTDVLIRAEHPITLESVAFSSAELPRLPESALTLGGGIVPGGFALGEGGDWLIYGQRSPDGLVLNLAVSPGHRGPPSEAFVRALSEIAAGRFLLVDWYAGAIVDTSAPEPILRWSRRNHSSLS